MDLGLKCLKCWKEWQYTTRVWLQKVTCLLCKQYMLAYMMTIVVYCNSLSCPRCWSIALDLYKEHLEAHFCGFWISSVNISGDSGTSFHWFLEVWWSGYQAPEASGVSDGSHICLFRYFSRKAPTPLGQLFLTKIIWLQASSHRNGQIIRRPFMHQVPFLSQHWLKIG